jgi:signal peptidase I
MKYKRMFCWVRPHEKKALKKAVNEQFPLEFAKNFDDFKKQIRKGDYLIFSLSKAKNISKVLQLVRSFSSIKFNLFALREKDYIKPCHIIIMKEKNVTKGQYLADTLVLNYLGEIKDLWEWNQNTDDFKSPFYEGDEVVV